MTWIAPQSDVTISEDHAQYRSVTTSWSSQAIITGSPPPTSTILIALNPVTEYDVRVRAASVAGDGDWSEVQTERIYNKFSAPHSRIYILRHELLLRYLHLWHILC